MQDKIGEKLTFKLNIKSMKAITVIQPWAECIVSKGKNVENRQKRTTHRGFIAIHASGTKSQKNILTIVKNGQNLNLYAMKCPMELSWVSLKF